MVNYIGIGIFLAVVVGIALLGIFLAASDRTKIGLTLLYISAITCTPIALEFFYLSPDQFQQVSLNAPFGRGEQADPPTGTYPLLVGENRLTLQQIDWTVFALSLVAVLSFFGNALYWICVPESKVRHDLAVEDRKFLRGKPRGGVGCTDYSWILFGITGYMICYILDRTYISDILSEALISLVGLVCIGVFGAYTFKVASYKIRRRTNAAGIALGYGALFTAFTVPIILAPVYDVFFAIEVIFLSICGVMVLEGFYFASGRCRF